MRASAVSKVECIFETLKVSWQIVIPHNVSYSQPAHNWLENKCNTTLELTFWQRLLLLESLSPLSAEIQQQH